MKEKSLKEQLEWACKRPQVKVKNLNFIQLVVYPFKAYELVLPESSGGRWWKTDSRVSPLQVNHNQLQGWEEAQKSLLANLPGDPAASQTWLTLHEGQENTLAL
jgi:hypothetical protein